MMLSLSILPWAISAFVLFLGCWLQTSLGFGMALIAAPIMVWVKPEWVPVVITVTALQLSLVNTWNQKDHLQIGLMSIAFITRVPGTVLGAWLLLHISTDWLQIAVATSVLVAVLLSLSNIQFQVSRFRLGLAGFTSGLMGTTTSIGGPPMALVMQHGDPKNTRANLSLFFTYSCTLSLVSYGLAGLLNRQLILESLSFTPVAALGFYLGLKTQHYVDGGKFRPLLLIVCSIAGILSLIGAIW